MNRNLMPLFLVVTLAAAAAGWACQPAIGDPCNTSVECPEGSTCDTTTLNGYCLKYDCTYAGCPDDSICVEFPTFTACMRHCTSSADCRQGEGYECREDLRPAPFCYIPDEGPSED